eukprot:s501_g11.t2
MWGVTANVQELKHVKQLRATPQAFAAILEDGSVVTWGSPYAGGDSSGVQAHGSVVTWGHSDEGGDSDDVQDQLRKVKQVEGTNGAFAALKQDGSITTWGSEFAGADYSTVRDQLKGVRKLWSCGGAFAAMLEDGSLVTWGIADMGGDSSAVQHQLKKVQQVHGADKAFAALLEDRSVITWGHSAFGGESSAVQHKLRNVQHLKAGYHAFVAILTNGTVVSCGESDSGGDCSQVEEQPAYQGFTLWNVATEATADAFAVILGDGSVVTWGDASAGGNSQAVQAELKSVERIESTCAAFAALLEQLRDVLLIRSTSFAFAALRRDGRVVTWGCPAAGGDSSSVSSELKDIHQRGAVCTFERCSLTCFTERVQHMQFCLAYASGSLEEANGSAAETTTWPNQPPVLEKEVKMAVAAFAARLREAFDEAGLDGQKCEFDEASGQMILHGEVTRVVPVGMLFAHFAACKDED